MAELQHLNIHSIRPDLDPNPRVPDLKSLTSQLEQAPSPEELGHAGFLSDFEQLISVHDEIDPKSPDLHDEPVLSHTESDWATERIRQATITTQVEYGTGEQWMENVPWLAPTLSYEVIFYFSPLVSASLNFGVITSLAY
jgi:hypothetical protein